MDTSTMVSLLRSLFLQTAASLFISSQTKVDEFVWLFQDPLPMVDGYCHERGLSADMLDAGYSWWLDFDPHVRNTSAGGDTGPACPQCRV